VRNDRPQLADRGGVEKGSNVSEVFPLPAFWVYNLLFSAADLLEKSVLLLT
jgi:predicted nucleic acid binding AN1-type Zn finger protein